MGRVEVWSLMIMAAAEGAREYVVPASVMAGEPGASVFEEMMNADKLFAVKTCEARVITGGGEEC